MAIIDIHTEPSGRTRMLFDFRAVAAGCDDVARIIDVMTRPSGGGSGTPAATPQQQPSGGQAASDLSTSRPVTLPSRRRISAS
jgi:hypothetical protein